MVVRQQWLALPLRFFGLQRRTIGPAIIRIEESNRIEFETPTTLLWYKHYGMYM